MAPLPWTINPMIFTLYMWSGLAAYLVSFAILMAPLPWTINPMIFTFYMLSGLAAYLISFAIGMGPLPWTTIPRVLPFLRCQDWLPTWSPLLLGWHRCPGPSIP
jgi:hypothetical protein